MNSLPADLTSLKNLRGIRSWMTMTSQHMLGSIVRSRDEYSILWRGMMPEVEFDGAFEHVCISLSNVSEGHSCIDLSNRVDMRISALSLVGERVYTEGSNVIFLK